MASTGHGTWLARASDEQTGKQHLYKPIGELSELLSHLRFDAAQKVAGEWFDHLGRGGAPSVTTVRDACARYVGHLRATKTQRAASDAESRFQIYVLNYSKLASTDLSKLTQSQIEGWRQALSDEPTRAGPRRGHRRSDSTLNRDMTCFRAALNLALNDGLASSDLAWRTKLRPIKNADKRREFYLDRSQRKLLVAHAEPDLAIFLRGLSLLPLRPGALAALRSADFDTRLEVLKIGHDKAGGDRRIKLPPATATFFSEATKDKLPEDPLLSRRGGQPWNKDSWKWPVKAAVLAAGLPATTTAYALRHSVISDLVHDGLDLLTVAQISGTSVLMIERHYGHLRGEIASSALARLVF